MLRLILETKADIETKSSIEDPKLLSKAIEQLKTLKNLERSKEEIQIEIDNIKEIIRILITFGVDQSILTEEERALLNTVGTL